MTMGRIVLLAALAGLLLPAAAMAQDRKREAQLRTVHGTVVDKDENALPGGVVFLKNVKTQIVKTYNANEKGEYRFSGLDPNVDYEIHAEDQEMKSTKRTISSFDSRKEIVITLKVDKKKE
ncbi:MAG: carboxypeptidase regulatory-like domain-containing protein [Acidobacteria bacterium]|nr:carboxypeptidase regulatory-like domain-containing protein [Acidobacteriota bacterium]MBI3662650.1 carboxypeptidase regulatory-like domain-containing protein [Acidobacteriota bacterium]